MAKINYQFSDGNYAEIEVTDKFKHEYEFMLVQEKAPCWKAIKQKQRAKIPTGHDWSLSKMIDDGIDYPDKCDPLEKIIGQEDRNTRINKLLGCLTEKQKEVYILYHIKGLKKVWIATQLNIDERSVRRRLEWAEKRIIKNFLQKCL